MPEVLIRPLGQEDYDQWASLWKQYLAFYETELDEDIYRSTFSRMIGNDPHEFFALVAEVNGELVGLVHYLFHRHGWKIENVCYLQDLFTAPQIRGKGIGRTLIEAVYRAADEKNSPSVYWLTQEFNQTARALYDKVAEITPFIKYNRKPL